MNTIYYTYNNEAIASCTYLSILNKTKSMDIARSCLVLPFLLDERIVNFLLKNLNEDIDLESFIHDKSRLFVSFNKRFLALLPVSVNSLVLLNNSNQVSIKDDNIRIIKHFIPNNEDMGKRFHKIRQVVPLFIEMINKYPTAYLYQILKIQL